jgi:hypothetical protein
MKDESMKRRWWILVVLVGLLTLLLAVAGKLMRKSYEEREQKELQQRAAFVRSQLPKLKSGMSIYEARKITQAQYGGHWWDFAKPDKYLEIMAIPGGRFLILEFEYQPESKAAGTSDRDPPRFVKSYESDQPT